MVPQESPPAQKQQQEQPQPPQGHGIMASPPNPPPLQPYQQEQQPPPPHRHGAMEATSTQPPPQPQNHQQEKINSYILPAKIIFHQSQEKKKRGRPRKSFDDGLRFSPTLTSKSPGAAPSENSSDKFHESLQRSRKKKQPQALDSNVGGGGGVASSENLAKKFLERPLWSENKKKQEDLGVVGSGWTPHSIHVNIGEDIVCKIMTFTRQEPRRQIVNIISASGVICDVTLHKFAIGGGTVTYEGQFVIISLSGSLVLSESNGSLSITGDLSVSLTGPDNKVLCGVVSGKLKAASPVQVVLSSFIQDNVLNFGASITEVTSSSQDASSNLADENGGSPDLNHE